MLVRVTEAHQNETSKPGAEAISTGRRRARNAMGTQAIACCVTSDKKERTMTAFRSLSILLLLILSCSLETACLVPIAAAEETPKNMLAAQIRSQGIACERPERALRDVKRSRPDHDVWILTCENATYRISRYPDLAAKVERIR